MERSSSVLNSALIPPQIIGTVVEFYGSLTFRNNIAIETSALHLLSFGQVLFTHGLTVTFEGNIGRCVSVALTQGTLLFYMLKKENAL